MRKNLTQCLGLLAMLCTLAFGYSAKADEAANIHQGNIEVGGSASISNFHPGNGADSSTSFTIAPTAQFFLIDHLSVGGAANWTRQFGDNGSTFLAIGPAATYYFAVMDKLAPFFSDAILYNHFGFNSGGFESNIWSNSASLGVDFFLNQAVAIGPALNWAHSFSHEATDSTNSYSVLINFHMFL